MASVAPQPVPNSTPHAASPAPPANLQNERGPDKQPPVSAEKSTSPAPSLTVRIVRGPLPPTERTRILSDYNRATGSREPVQRFRRWTEQSPSGPALHALLETADGRLAGHCALVPFGIQGPDGATAIAKEHYFFVSEKNRSTAAQDGPEKKEPAALLLEQLHARAAQQGWRSIVACVPPRMEPVHVALGYLPVDFAVRDCFFLLHPVRGWHAMRHLQLSRRVSLLAASAANWTYASCISPLQRTSAAVHHSRIADHVDCFDGHPSRLLSFSHDPAFLRWRYPDSCYTPLTIEDSGHGYVIATKGTPFSFARVCQFHIPSARSIAAVVDKLIRDARAAHAIGIRWSVYGAGPEQDRLVEELRKRTFLCFLRKRRILISASGPELTSAAKWNLADWLFTFAS